MNELINKIIEAGIKAPSGENCQPWNFEIKDGKIYLYNVPGRDQSLYNFNQMGSLISHGAVIENMSIAANALEQSLDVKLFPEEANTNLVAIISLREGSGEKSRLADYIGKRFSNRKKYKKTKLNEEKQKIMGLFLENIVTDCKFIFTNDQSDINVLSKVASLNEKVMLENENIHKFFFTHVNWTKEEDAKNRSGFYLKSLELEPPAEAAFKLFSNWNVLKKLNLIGASNFVAKQNQKVYSSAGAYGIIVAPNLNPEVLIEVGRLFEKFWLTMTKENIFLHPLTGALYFAQRILHGDDKEFSPKHREQIIAAYDLTKKIFGVTKGEVVMMFRLGEAEAPTATSSRYDFNTLCEIK